MAYRNSPIHDKHQPALTHHLAATSHCAEAGKEWASTGVVLATSRLLYPAAVGSDIGCGMAAIGFDANADVFGNEIAAATLLADLYRYVPANRHHRETMPESLPDDLLARALSCPRLEAEKQRDARVQFGSLGRGNHFLEFQADQVAAGQLGQDTRFASVQLGSPDASGSGHGPGLSLAWDKRGKPVAGLGTPVQVFHKLFSADDLPLEQRQAAIAEQRSVLDAVFTEAKRVQRGLTKTDQDKLGEYFQGIRNIETRLSKDEDWLTVPNAKHQMEEPDPGLKGREEIKVMYDLIAAALQTDSTRVMTYRQPVQSLLQSMDISVAPHNMSHYSPGIAWKPQRSGIRHRASCWLA